MDSKKRNSNNNNIDDIESQPITALVWFQKMLALAEETTMCGFVESFGTQASRTPIRRSRTLFLRVNSTIGQEKIN